MLCILAAAQVHIIQLGNIPCNEKYLKSNPRHIDNPLITEDLPKILYKPFFYTTQLQPNLYNTFSLYLIIPRKLLNNFPLLLHLLFKKS